MNKKSLELKIMRNVLPVSSRSLNTLNPDEDLCVISSQNKFIQQNYFNELIDPKLNAGTLYTIINWSSDDVQFSKGLNQIVSSKQQEFATTVLSHQTDTAATLFALTEPFITTEGVFSDDGWVRRPEDIPDVMEYTTAPSQKYNWYKTTTFINNNQSSSSFYINQDFDTVFASTDWAGTAPLPDFVAADFIAITTDQTSNYTIYATTFKSASGNFLNKKFGYAFILPTSTSLANVISNNSKITAAPIIHFSEISESLGNEIIFPMAAYAIIAQDFSNKYTGKDGVVSVSFTPPSLINCRNTIVVPTNSATSIAHHSTPTTKQITVTKPYNVQPEPVTVVPQKLDNHGEGYQNGGVNGFKNSGTISTTAIILIVFICLVIITGIMVIAYSAYRSHSYSHV